jgi:acetyl esterase/lipase
MMIIRLLIFICYITSTTFIYGQDISQTEKYLAEHKFIGNSFATYFYPRYAQLYTLSEEDFVSKIDSARQVFEGLLQEYAGELKPEFVSNQKLEIKYYFDKILLDYPINHDTYQQTAEKTILSAKLSKQLQGNLRDFNKPDLLANPDFKEYVRAYFHHAVNERLDSSKYELSENRSLSAVWDLIPQLVSDSICRTFWQAEYLYNHIENNGIKGTDGILREFRSIADPSVVEKINKTYSEDSIGRKGHQIQSYKTVDGVSLDLHLFLPDSLQFKGRRPVYIYFHGGSWSEGKPDWGFESCESYMTKGWIGVAVEYRTVSRHNSLPFESVMDARSAVRWLRKHADQFNIDTTKIVAAGNSAGGHLVLATALATNWNEDSDDLMFSPIPNLMLVNSGVYDLTIDNTKWIARKLDDKQLVMEISPNHFDKSNMPPLLAIHGADDTNCPSWTAEEFKKAMQATDPGFEIHFLQGAGHFIWYDPRFTEQISTLRSEFLLKHGFE